MSKTLSKLLNKSEAEVAALIRKLEDLNGYPSQDVRLIAHIAGRSRQKVAQLGLDPDDTTAEELYAALKVKYDGDSAQIDKAIGITDVMSLDERQAKALQLINHIGPLPDIWALKNSSAKKALQANPPKKVMRQLNYRSIGSFIKKVDPGEVYLAAPYVESANWQKSFYKDLSKLNSADFEIRPAKAIRLQAGKWQDVRGPRLPAVFNSAIGAVAVWPGGLPEDTPVLTLCLYLLDGLHGLTGKDLSVSFYNLHPALNWWADSAALISSHDQEAVSFNIKDIAISHLKRHNFGQRTARHGRKLLMRTLLSKYERQPEEMLDISASNLADQWQMPLAQLAREYVVAE